MSIADSIKNDHDDFRGMIAKLQKTAMKSAEERNRTFSDIRQKVSDHF